jgi:hypothetical protein
MDLGVVTKYYVLGLVFNVENFVLALASLVKTNMVVRDFSKNHLLIPIGNVVYFGESYKIICRKVLSETR